MNKLCHVMKIFTKSQILSPALTEKVVHKIRLNDKSKTKLV